MVSEIISLAREREVPVIFALTRRQLAKVMHAKVRIAVVSVLMPDGGEPLLKAMVAEAAQLRSEQATASVGDGDADAAVMSRVRAGSESSDGDDESASDGEE